MTLHAVALWWLHFMLGAGGLLAVAALSLRWLSQPADRMRLIQCTILAAAALPVWLLLAPGVIWRWEITADSASPPAAASASNVARVGTPTPPSVVAPVESFIVDASRESSEHPISPASSPDPTLAPSIVPSLDLLATLGLLVIAAHSVAAVYLAVEWWSGRRRLRSLANAATPATSEMLAAWRRVTRDADERLRLLVSPDAIAPFAFGVRRPTIVVPRAIAEAGGASLDCCLAHEWSHVVRGDLLWHLAVQLLQFVLWPQPWFWTLRRELRQCQDLLADDLATADGRDPVSYAELLLSLVKQRSSSIHTAALSLLDRPGLLSERVTLLLTKPAPWRRASSRRFSLAIVGALGGAALLLGSLRIEAAPPPAVTPPTDAPNALAQAAPPAPAAAPAAAQADAVVKYQGRVVEGATGNPIAGASVTVRRRRINTLGSRGDDAMETLGAKTYESNAEGSFTFDVPQASLTAARSPSPFVHSVEFAVSHPDYAANKEVSTYLEHIDWNQRKGVAWSFERIELWKAADVTGRLTTRDGRPIAGVEVEAYQELIRPKKDPTRDDVVRITATSDAEGRFKLPLYQGGRALIQYSPEEFVPGRRLLGEQRGDLGDLALDAGARVQGRVASASGQGVADLTVGITPTAEVKILDNLFDQVVASTPNVRQTQTDSAGRFRFGPLPPGEYLVGHSGVVVVEGERIPLPDVYLPERVTLQAGVEPAEIEPKPAPAVALRVRWLNSRGEPRTAPDSFDLRFSGELNGVGFVCYNRPSPEPDGAWLIRLPRGLSQIHWRPMDMSRSGAANAWRYRTRPGEPLQNFAPPRRDAPFAPLAIGPLTEDWNGFEAISYVEPSVTLAVLDEQGRPIDPETVTLQYELQGGGGGAPDYRFIGMKDGRWLARGLLPDEPTTFTVKAPGYEPATQRTSFKEGEQRELTFKLKAVK